MRIVGRDGARDVSAEKFFLGPFTTAVGPGELLTSVTVPAPRPGQGDAFAAVGVGREGMGIVHAAASVRVNSTIQDAGLVLGCVAPAPVRASDVEAALRGSEPTESAVHDSVQGLGQTLNPGSDVNASDEYRRFASEVLAERAIKQAIERGRARCG